MYHNQDGPTVGKAEKGTVVAALVIWEKVRIYAHFAQHVISSVCKTRTWYDNCCLLKNNRLCVESNEASFELFDISQKYVMNSTTNDKLREQAISNNAVERSHKYVYS